MQFKDLKKKIITGRTDIIVPWYDEDYVHQVQIWRLSSFALIAIHYRSMVRSLQRVSYIPRIQQLQRMPCALISDHSQSEFRQVLSDFR